MSNRYDLEVMNIAKIIIRTPLWRDLDYLIPDALLSSAITEGLRVLVPFGSQEVIGIVLTILNHSDVDPKRLKPILKCLDDEPFVSPSILRLCVWASEYYHFPLGEVLFTVLPSKFSKIKPITRKKLVPSCLSARSEALTLSVEQQQALMTIESITGFGVVLLHGITGSGKTEVYLRAIERCLLSGHQALVLVPEISLTPQTLQRFQDRLDVPIVSLHSQLKESERFNHWMLAQSGEARIVIGTRSAIFVPMPKLGLIIIDEEHDTSFKQQSSFRYSARDLAVMRGYDEKIPIILGSATPSLESFYNALRGKYHYATLPKRAGIAKPPRIQLLDIREARLTGGLSEALLSVVDQHLEAGGQVLFFLNRRGFAPILLCHECGYSVLCPRCDACLTYHQEQRELNCHHCDYAIPMIKICPKCHRSDLMPVGVGTERLEETLRHRFPKKHTIRIDRDSTRKKGSLENMLLEAHANTAHILIGTQMLAKGHHFQNLTLVAIVDADSGLLSTDFRALERLGQLLIQVAGRSGREHKLGEVMIQTHYPDHPMLQLLFKEGYTEFAKHLLLERQEVGLPPYGYIALLRAEGINQSLPIEFLTVLKKQLLLQLSQKITLLGPINAYRPKRAGMYRAQLLIQSTCRRELQLLLGQLDQNEWLKKNRRKVHWSLDIDPIELM